VREVIEQILDTEKDAERAVEQAHASAAELRSKADAEAADLLAHAREDAQLILRNEAQRARDAAKAARDVLVGKAEEENARFLERQERNVGRLVDAVVRVLLTPEHARK
jgi:vacuolar-type H+-ATPase subunit H